MATSSDQPNGGKLTGSSIVESLGITPLIDAGGPNTKNSGSRPRPEAIEAMEAMSEVFVDIDELLLAAGERIAALTGNEAATITSGVAGALVVQAAVAMAKDDPKLISQLPITDGIPNELIIQRGHRFIYDHLYLSPGSRFVEVGRPTEAPPQRIAATRLLLRYGLPEPDRLRGTGTSLWDARNSS